jgi:hypothetical protein
MEKDPRDRTIVEGGCNVYATKVHLCTVHVVAYTFKMTFSLRWSVYRPRTNGGDSIL